MDDLADLQDSSSTPVTPLMEVKCRKNFLDLRYVVNNVDNMHELNNAANTELRYPPKITISGTDIRAKEVILVLMALCLLICSICLFFKHWKKNYRDINQVMKFL